MKSNRSKAFTIVEIIVVISVVAILSSLAVITYTTIRQDSRDATRQSNATIISEALEKYYEKNGEYPSVASLANERPANTGEVVASRLSIPATSLVMPSMPITKTNALTANPEPQDDYIAYVAQSAQDDLKCQEDVNGGCDKFTLKYLEESSGEVVTIDSRHSSRMTTVKPDLEVSVTSTTSIGATWSALADAQSYELQRSLSNDFSSPITTAHPSTTATASGLLPDTEYFFRVRAVFPDRFSDWSDTQSATTSSLGAPTGTITITAAMSGTNARGTAGGGTCPSGTAIERQIRYQVNTNAWVAYTTGSPRDVAATEGYKYTFQAQARCVAGSTYGPWASSTTASVTRSVTAPSGLTITAAMSGTNARGTAAGGTCATGTTIERQIRYEATSTATAGTYVAYTTGTPRDVAANQGWRYTFQQQARCVGTNASSGWAASGTAAVVRPILAPAAPVLSASASGSTVTWTWPAVTCPTGTSAQYQILRTSAEMSNYNSGWGAPTTSRTWSWANADGYNLTVQVQARCISTHSTGAWSATGTRSFVAPVAPPAAPTSFVYYLNPERTYDSWTWTPPTCKSGQRAEFYDNSYIEGAGWYWVATGQEGWRYGTNGWSPRQNGPPTYGTWNESPYPWGNKVKVQHKAKYVCINTTTGRVSADGPVGISQMVTVP